MTDDSGFKTKKLLDAFVGFIKGNKWYFLTQGKNYTIKLPASGVVNVLGNGPSRANRWIFRIDRPHKGVPYNHLNINPRSSGLPKDPHIQLPPGTLPVSRGVARFCQAVNQVNKVAIPLAIAIDMYRTGKSIIEDVKNKTSRNTVETLSSVAGGWGGGYGGAVVGAALGSACLPGIGTIVGGIFGAIGGGIGGALGASKIVNSVGDACNYDVITKKCKECGDDFKVIKYRREIDISPFCEECRIEEEIEIEIKSNNLISLNHVFPQTKIPKWPNFTLDALVEILTDKAAIFFVCISETKFVKPNFKSACFETGKDKNMVFVVATSKSWTQSDIEAAIMGFEYAALCIRIVFDVTKIDSAKVFDSMFKLFEGKDSEDPYELVVVGKNKLCWKKPDWGHFNRVMSHLEAASYEKNVKGGFARIYAQIS